MCILPYSVSCHENGEAHSLKVTWRQWICAALHLAGEKYCSPLIGSDLEKQHYTSYEACILHGGVVTS